MALEAIVEPGIAAMVGSVITGLISVNIAVIKWLVGKFAKVSDKLDAQYLSFNNQMDGHEVKDQARHEENLHRFEKVSVALAKLGSDNGTYNKRNN